MPFGTKSLDKNAEDGKITLTKGDTLKLRHRLIFHKGDENNARIADAYKKYTKE